MNAVEFVKKVGICEAKAVLLKSEYHFEVDVYLPDMKEFTYIAINPTDSCPYVGLSDLKQIVDAFELVESLGGMAMAKDVFDIEIHEPHYNYDAEKVTRIEQAINLMEQCL